MNAKAMITHRLREILAEAQERDDRTLDEEDAVLRRGRQQGRKVFEDNGPVMV